MSDKGIAVSLALFVFIIVAVLKYESRIVLMGEYIENSKLLFDNLLRSKHLSV